LKVAQEPPILEHVLLYDRGGGLNNDTVGSQPKPAVAISRQRHAAGPILLKPLGDHRIVIHDSLATWSTCMTSGSRHLRRRGDIDIVPAGEEGGFAADTGCEALEIRVAPRLLERAAKQLGHAVGRPHLKARHILRDEPIVYLAKALQSERKPGIPHGLVFAEAIGLALATQLASLSKENIAFGNGLSAKQLKRVFDFIEAHIDGPVTIDTLAREAGASSSHLRHWFKQAMGTTIHRYVIKRRVERARLLLGQGTLSLSEVALAAGFAHQSHMARWMRRELGYSPREMP